MVRSIFSKKDLNLLGSVFQATVLSSDDGSKLVLLLYCNTIAPPAWLQSLSFALVHDDGTILLCRSTYDGRRCSPSRFTIEAPDGRDLSSFFQARENSLHLAIGEVAIRTAQGNTKILANTTSLKAFRNQSPPTETDLEECLLDLSKLEPSE